MKKVFLYIFYFLSILSPLYANDFSFSENDYDPMLDSNYGDQYIISQEELLEKIDFLNEKEKKFFMNMIEVIEKKLNQGVQETLESIDDIDLLEAIFEKMGVSLHVFVQCLLTKNAEN